MRGGGLWAERFLRAGAGETGCEGGTGGALWEVEALPSLLRAGGLGAGGPSDYDSRRPPWRAEPRPQRAASPPRGRAETPGRARSRRWGRRGALGGSRLCVGWRPSPRAPRCSRCCAASWEGGGGCWESRPRGALRCWALRAGAAALRGKRGPRCREGQWAPGVMRGSASAGLGSPSPWCCSERETGQGGAEPVHGDVM